MNFLDAHKMVHGFAGALAKRADENSLLFRPISYLPIDFNRDKLIDAYKIFYAHMIFYNSRTQEQYEQYELVRRNINTFVPDDFYADVIKTVKIVTGKNIIYKLLNRSEINRAIEKLDKYTEISINSMKSYKGIEVEEYFIKMQAKKAELINKYNTGYEKLTQSIYNLVIDEYCSATYQSAGLVYNNEYFRFFQSFEKMREIVLNGNSDHYYAGYENYILSNQ